MDPDSTYPEWWYAHRDVLASRLHGGDITAAEIAPLYEQDRSLVPEAVDSPELVASVIWLERLASRCKLHGYANEARALRDRAERIRGALSPTRISLGDERYREPVTTDTLTEFIRLCQIALGDARVRLTKSEQASSPDPDPSRARDEGSAGDVVVRFAKMEDRFEDLGL